MILGGELVLSTHFNEPLHFYCRCILLKFILEHFDADGCWRNILNLLNMATVLVTPQPLHYFPVRIN